MMDFSGIRVHIIGLGGLGTGQACARALLSHGASVEISDCKSKKDLAGQLAALQMLPITFHLGNKAYSDIDRANLVIPSPGVPFDLPALQQARAGGALVVSEIEVAYWLAPCPIIAVTGTKGKTTTATLIGKLLEAEGHSVLLGGNIGTPLIQQVQLADSKHVLVAEVSSFQLEGVRDFRPHIAVFLNFFADHLDRHPSLNAYWQAKLKIFSSQRSEDYAILNFDDPALKNLADRLKAHIISFGINEPTQARCRDGFLYINDEKICARDKIRLRGRHNLYNVLAALAAAQAAGASLKKAEEVLSNFKGVANRLEEVAVIDDVTFINDSQATIPQAAEVALEAMEAPVILIAGGRPKVADFSSFARAICKHAKALILMGEAAKSIAAAAKQAGFNAIHFAASLPEAVRSAKALAEPGEIVLLSPACASFDMFKDMSQRGEVFRQAVLNLAKKSEAPRKPAISTGARKPAKTASNTKRLKNRKTREATKLR
jgi:UDP-N-acetylmuramoylalanine--D-glutamate ligase